MDSKPPIDGMTRVPCGMPFMADAWIGCVMWAAGEEGCRKAFKEATGYDLEMLIRRSPIEALIDKSTGHERTVMMAFLDYVTENIWGEEEIKGNKKVLTSV